MKSFDCLPIAALVHGQLFCVHGCISPEIRSIREISDINRMMEPPTKGFIIAFLIQAQSFSRNLKCRSSL